MSHILAGLEEARVNPTASIRARAKRLEKEMERLKNTKAGKK